MNTDLRPAARSQIRKLFAWAHSGMKSGYDGRSEGWTVIRKYILFLGFHFCFFPFFCLNTRYIRHNA